MFIRTVKEIYLHKRWNTHQVRHHDMFTCDQCDKEFMLGHKVKHAVSGALTFCSQMCRTFSRKSGKLANKIKCVMMDRHGVTFGAQVSGAGQKMIETRIARTGASAPSMQSSSSNGKFKETMLERHGVEHPSKSEKIQGRKVETYQKRYGVDNPLSRGSKFRSVEGCVLGGQIGYRSIAKKYGAKALSKPEAMMMSMLHEKFGASNIEQQVMIDHGERKAWLIDFYVRSLSVYVEVDGVFWHGLNVPYDQLHPTKREKFDADRKQDAWFKSQGLKLVRITDQELLACSIEDKARIFQRLEG